MNPPGQDEWLRALAREAGRVGKPGWRGVLKYCAELHGRSTHEAAPPFEFEWEDSGVGYGYGPAFGHWDIVHQILDVLPTATDHGRQQLLNDIRLQLANGFLPGLVKMPGAEGLEGRAYFYKDEIEGHPPVWVEAAREYVKVSGDQTLVGEFFERATRQIGWFEEQRAAHPGFFYNDIICRKWESGVDEGVRFDEADLGPRACIDATSHVYQLCDCAAEWAEMLGKDATAWRRKARRLGKFVRNFMWDEQRGFFFDSWAIENPALRRQAFDGMWPVVVGIATAGQANRVIDEWLLDPERFFTKHPISTVGASDEKFELRMWRGPSWNSMTYWAARGCLRYGRADAAVKLVEAALDDTAEQFRRSGTIWEFYHPHGGRPEELKRKPQTGRNQPFGDYIGHNPLLAMARLWEKNLGVAGKAPVWMWGVLILLLLLGAWVRFHNIERNGLWVDEMWAVFIACGRGVSAFHIPVNQVLDPAPQLGLAGAPAWWTIWTNVGTSIHPPLYHLTLRGWMNVFGQGDLATRSMSVMFGLLGFVLLFDVVRKMSGNAAGICAAAVMTMAVSQIDFAQEARPYTMMVVLGLIACRAVVLIERSGARVGLLIQLMLAALASFLTHYFTVFSFAGLGIYVLWRLRGRERVKAAGAIVIGGVVAAAAWGPWFWRQYQSGDMGGMLGEIVHDSEFAWWRPVARVAKLAADHLYGTAPGAMAAAIGVIVFVIPLLLIRKQPEGMLWWLWAVTSMAGITIADLVHHTLIASNMRYTFLATPAICALVSSPLPWRGWKGWVLPGTVLASVAIACAARVQYGEAYPSWPLISRPDFRALARLVDKTAGPGDALVFYPDAYIGTPIYFYATFNHYAPESRRAVAILDGPADGGLEKKLGAYSRVWLVGVQPMGDAARVLPGWKARDGSAISRVGGIARVFSASGN